jgi:hypothetical protein
MPKADGKTLQERFKERYTVDPNTGCWNWTAGTNGKGYAYIWTGPNRKGDTRQAYKVAWEFKYGPVPAGLELHHTCGHRLCVNPDHLKPKTRREHQREHPQSIITGANALKTVCPNGHKYTHKNKAGSRCCRICLRDAMRRIRKTRKAG